MTSKKEQWKGKRRDGRRRGRRIDRDTGARAGEDGKQKKRSVFWQGTGLSTSRQGIDFHLAASFTFFFFFPPPPPSSSSLPVIEISHPFPPFLVPIDTLVIDSAAQPSGKLNKRNLITGGFCWESFSRYYTLGRIFSLFFFFSLFRRPISNKSFESIMRISRNEILQSTRSTKLWFLWTGWFEGGGGGTFVCARKWNVESWFVANTGYVTREFVARLIRLPVSKQPWRYVATQFVVSRGHPRRAGNRLCSLSSLIATIFE